MHYKIVVGLGNPDKKYEKTYHNAGFLAIDFLTKNNSEKWQTASSKDFEYLKTNGLVFAKTLVYMNESGKALKSIIKYFKADPKDLLIVHDDSDIVLGNYKLSNNRGAAGHHGIESVQQHIKNNDFGRLRIGIRPMPKTDTARRVKAEEFVLKKISRPSMAILEKTFQNISKELFS
ncbi:MAG: aminoacyl-tRNA hydrolase [Candidatus Pacebacteria bacterium]|nr:aminoacyl-tRNA hydrolase [Candidatus Paceibacterota bacterium]